MIFIGGRGRRVVRVRSTARSAGLAGQALKAELLALTELRRLARFVQARLLALDDTSVARQEAGPLERDPQLRIGLDERARDAVTDRACLSARAAAVNADADVEGPLHSCRLQLRQRRRAVRGARKVILDRAPVEPCVPVAGTQDHSCDGRLPLARPTVLRELTHLSSHFNGCGACGPCGCSGP